MSTDTATNGTVQAPAVEPTSTPPSAPAENPANSNSAPAPAVDGAPKKSAAELKKQRQAEKQARRQQNKASGPPSAQRGGPAKPQKEKPQKEKPQKEPKDDKRPLPTRRRPSQPTIPVLKDPKKEVKVPKRGLVFGHLYTQPRQHSVVGATKDVHPAIIALGLQYSSYVICGSTARMVAMLLAFKAVIESYQTPVGTSLARHLTSHHLSPQIDYLRNCRPLSISMGNAIRWLKDIIIKIDPSTPELEAKRDLLSEIDDFIRDRVTVADRLIAEFGSTKIENGDVVLTYAASSIVEKTLIYTHKQFAEDNKKFSVIVVDSKPLFEGKQLARKLAHHGIPVKYFLVTGASHAIKQASKVLLGAHAMMSNGRLYSRVGTAIISMLAHAQSLPVIVLCESVKFTDRVALDSIVSNEVAPAEELLSEPEREDLATLKPYLPQGLLNKLGMADDEADKKAKPSDTLKWIEGSENLQMLQILYDVTPAEYIDIVITEYGSLPPSSVPVVHRQSTDQVKR